MEPTKEESIALFRKQWTIHSIDPYKTKKEVCKLLVKGPVTNSCFLCHYVKQTTGSFSISRCHKFCPIEWPQILILYNSGCEAPCEVSHYGKWFLAQQKITWCKYDRSKMVLRKYMTKVAGIIKDLPEKV